MTRDQIAKVKNALKLGFKEYLRETVTRTSQLKTILYRDKSVYIDNNYVPTRFSCDGVESAESEIFSRLDRNKRVVVSGNAGCGKSIFAEHAAWASSSQGDDRIPTFVELRQQAIATLSLCLWNTSIHRGFVTI